MRIDRYSDPDNDESGKDNLHWDSDLAVYTLQAAAAGMPLTSDEVRRIQEHFTQALETYESWPRWNLWDASVEDGVYSHRDGFLPHDGGTLVRIEEMATVLLYCFSPFRNPTGIAPVDCEVASDSTLWGN